MYTHIKLHFNTLPSVSLPKSKIQQLEQITMKPTQKTSCAGQMSNFNILHQGPSEYIKNLVKNLYVEGLDPPRTESKISILKPSQNTQSDMRPLVGPATSPVFRRQSPHDKTRLSGPKMFSNDMKDCCKHKCRLCNKIYTLTAMRGHCKMIHQMSIKEYQHKHGNVRDMIEVVMWHRCILCKADFLLDSDEIHKHANLRHKMSLREYTQQFLVLKNRGYVRRSDIDNSQLIDSLKREFLSPVEVIKQESPCL